MNDAQPFLPPIEKPKGLMMKIVYFLTKQNLGKVITPVKVFSVRLPVAFGMMGAKVYQLDKKLVLPKVTSFLVRHKVASLNVCEFCMDISRYKGMKELMSEEKIDAISEYHSSTLFSDSEKAALDYVTELTKDKKINPQTFAKLAAYYSEREICEIVYLVASEHLSNITNIGLNIHSDMFCSIKPR